MLFLISEDFFKLQTSWYPVILDELFDNVIKGYKTRVLQSMKEYALHHLDQAVKLENFFHPDLADILARQRKDYGLSDKFEAEFPVENLSQHADVNSPINNTSMESY